jgi:putative ABC transport system permease protein
VDRVTRVTAGDLPTALRRPFVLLRFPAVAGAVAVAALILGISAAAGPMFESSVANGVIASGLAEHGRVLVTVPTDGSLAADVIGFQERRLVAALSAVPGAGGLRATMRVPGLTIAPVPKRAGRPAHVQLVSRDGFEEHVDVLARDASVTGGVWIAESTAARLHLRPGDEVRLSSGRRDVGAAVAAVYRDLFVGAQDPFWARLAADIYPAAPKEPPPPPPVLATPTVFLRCSSALESSGLHWWDVGVGAPNGLGFDDAVRTAAAVRRLLADVATPRTEVGAAVQAPSASSPFLGVVGDARTTRDGLAGPVRTFSTAGEVAALLGLLAASVYGVRRRRLEVRLLDALGLSPAGFGLRSAIEALLPVVLGCVAGWAIAGLVVSAIGASSSIDASAVVAAARGAAVGAALGVVVVGIGSAAAMRAETAEARSSALSRAAARMPWELGVLVLSGVAFYEIVTRGTAPVVARGGGVRIDGFVLLFPVLFMLGGAGVVVQLLVRGLRLARSGGGDWPFPIYLAARRLSAAPRVTVLLTTAVALAVGILVYSASISGSLGVATNDKARLGIGADVAGAAPQLLSFPPTHGVAATNVVRILAAARPGDRPVTLLGVDPSTFAAAAFWDPRFSDDPLGTLMGAIARPGSALPVIVDGASASPSAISLGGYDVPVRMAGTTAAFPGQGGGSTLVLSTPALERTLAARGLSLGDVGADVEVWARGRTARAVTYLEGLGVAPGSIRTADRFVRAPNFRAISSSFGFMELLGVLAAAVALVGVVLYLQARQRSRLISYAMTSRMGLSRSGHRAAVVAEIAAILLVAAVVGSVLAIVAGSAMSPWVDPLPSVAPAPSFRLPTGVLALVLLAVPLTAVVGAAIVQRRTDAGSVAEALRYAG